MAEKKDDDKKPLFWMKPEAAPKADHAPSIHRGDTRGPSVTDAPDKPAAAPKKDDEQPAEPEFHPNYPHPAPPMGMDLDPIEHDEKPSDAPKADDTAKKD